MPVGTTHINIGGVWKDLEEIHLNVNDNWKEVDQVWLKESGTWYQVYGKLYPLPVGAIIPYRGVTTPAGYTNFTNADGRFIVGSGGAYPVNSFGGASTKAIAANTSTTGSHDGGSSFLVRSRIIGTGPNYGGNAVAGSHSHTLSASVNTIQDFKDFRLIKATAEADVPSEGMILSHTVLQGVTGLVHVESSTNRFLRANSGGYGATGGSSVSSGAYTTSSNGSHIHYTGTRPNGDYDEFGTYSYVNYAAGNHNHTGTMSAALNTRYGYLAGWTHLSSEFRVPPYTIVMWESLTPPAGWAICNGANGTPDMRDKFLRIGSTGQMGTSGGSNSATYTSSTSTNGAHTHHGSYAYRYETAYIYGRHSSSLGAHSHTASVNVTSIIPPYYTLSFIMKLPT